jgi:hypothetical protein
MNNPVYLDAEISDTLHSFAIEKCIIPHICTKHSLQIVQPEDGQLMAETCSCLFLLAYHHASNKSLIFSCVHDGFHTLPSSHCDQYTTEMSHLKINTQFNYNLTLRLK